MDMTFLRLHFKKAALCAASLAVFATSFSSHAIETEQNQQPQRFIIQYKDKFGFKRMQSHNAQLSHMAGAEIKFKRAMALENFYVFELKNNASKIALSHIMSSLANHPDILSVEEDVMMQHMASPNDPRYTDQWHYYEAIGDINAEQVWNTHTGAGTVVAVIDTGYVYHSDLDANIIPGYDFISDVSVANDGDGRDADASDPGDWTGFFECGASFGRNSSWHGTHVAGTVAAQSNNNSGVAGVAYNAKVMPVRVLGKCGGLLSDITDAIVWASGGSVPGVPNTTTPADVINMSLGGSGACDATYQAAIDTAVANGQYCGCSRR